MSSASTFASARLAAMSAVGRDGTSTCTFRSRSARVGMYASPPFCRNGRGLHVGGGEGKDVTARMAIACFTSVTALAQRANVERGARC